MMTRQFVMGIALAGLCASVLSGCGKQEVKSDPDAISALRRNGDVFGWGKNVRGYLWANTMKDQTGGQNKTLQCWYYRETTDLILKTKPDELLGLFGQSAPVVPQFVDVQVLYEELVQDIAVKRTIVDALSLTSAGGCGLVGVFAKGPWQIAGTLCGLAVGIVNSGINNLSRGDVTFGGNDARDKVTVEAEKGLTEVSEVKWRSLVVIREKLVKVQRASGLTEHRCPTAAAVLQEKPAGK